MKLKKGNFLVRKDSNPTAVSKNKPICFGSNPGYQQQAEYNCFDCPVKNDCLTKN